MQTFVIRVWEPADDEVDPRPGGLRGLVEHASSGRRRPFTDEADLLAFLHACLERDHTPVPPPGGAA